MDITLAKHSSKLPDDASLTYKNRASCIKDGRTPTLHTLHFIYIFQQI